ncbi:MAG TPA: radical SAM protein [Thermoanaerobaculia bacterium]|nr:radical SAM protein [Thermoanaerobaculia bacterium]
MKPVELEIELFCRGMRIAPSARSREEGRPVSRTRAGLGSGLEVVLLGGRKKIWINVPVMERFALESPFLLCREREALVIRDDRDGNAYPVELPPEPRWYNRYTSSDAQMSRIGVLQGNYLAIYVSSRCLYWASHPSLACKFCTTGKNVGPAEEARKSVEDVVEVARAAREESGCIFTHLNTGYHYEDVPAREAIHGLRQCEPYVRALRHYVGGFVGVQAVPVPVQMFHEYDALIEAGTDHFSFCYEFEMPETFASVCPGKAATIGQHAFFRAMEYTAKKLGVGRVSGEIIAGIEPIEATKRGIDRIVSAGAFPTVCIFRPTIGSEMESVPPPAPDEMREVFAYVHQSCRRAGIPTGILPIEVSLVVQPEETADLCEPDLATRIYQLRNRALRWAAGPYVAWKKRPAA